MLSGTDYTGNINFTFSLLNRRLLLYDHHASNFKTLQWDDYSEQRFVVKTALINVCYRKGD